MKNVHIMMVAVLLLTGTMASAATMDSSLFPYKYEAGVLPSASVPAYTYASGSGTVETDVFSISGGVLKLDTDTNAASGEGAWYTLAGGASTEWDPHFLGGYTMEVRMKSFPNNSATYNTWFYWYDVNSATLLQVWHNKVYLNNVVVTDLDNQTDFHVFRIVSEKALSSNDQVFDLYRDGELIIDNAPNFADFSGVKMMFGDMTGSAEVNVEIDYIRWDDQNAWLPIPEPATMLMLGIGAFFLKRRS